MLLKNGSEQQARSNEACAPPEMPTAAGVFNLTESGFSDLLRKHSTERD